MGLRRRGRLVAVVVAVVVAAVAVVLVVTADDGDDVASVATTTSPAASPTAAPTTVRPCNPPSTGSDFAGFGVAQIVIQNVDGSHRSCVLTADTSAQQQQGLMRQADLDGYDGMLFRFPAAQEVSFWMRNTPLPLSIAFFGADGSFVSATDMEPCADRPDCPTYPSRGSAKFALEVVRGRLPAVGAGPGSRLLG